jgi:TetR/AcrR family transcriptional regulator, regulator of autoinduction and epiphytic fitness
VDSIPLYYACVSYATEMSHSGETSNEDPRIGRTRRAVREATLQVLADRGFGALTIESVAETARVAKSTIYRHWPSRLDLVSDALEALNVQPRSAPPSDDVRGDIERLLVHLTAAMSDSLLSDCMPALIDVAAREPEVAEFLYGYGAARRQTLVDLIAAGVASGDLPDHIDPELASLALAGAIAYRRFLTPDPLAATEVPALVTQVLGPTRSAPS